jgi:hypothetical protein
MPVDPRTFFKNYVLAPYEAWTADELCEWKAFAVVSGLNALVDHAYHHDPGACVSLAEFRNTLQPSDDHNHIRRVAEVYKHFALDRGAPVPSRFDEKSIREAGAFSSDDFSEDFDTWRPQIGFTYDGTPATWAPLRPVAQSCIDFWRLRLGYYPQSRHVPR